VTSTPICDKGFSSKKRSMKVMSSFLASAPRVGLRSVSFMESLRSSATYR